MHLSTDQLETLLLEALPPLHRRVRHASAGALAQRLVETCPRPAGVEGLAPWLGVALEALETELAALHAEFVQFTRQHNEAADDAARREVLVAHLKATVKDRKERKEDLRALDRWMGFDALRERQEKRRHKLLVEEETALRALTGVLAMTTPRELQPSAIPLALMAEHVQPEIGVLKVFPQARVRGRLLTFINGHSANERTGFMNNWTRTGLGDVDPEANPERAVITVINNRWDRVSRSEVFARIMVEDAPADRHVLIGTNLEGLRKYVRGALDRHLLSTEVVAAEELSTADGEGRAEARLAKELARLKVPRPTAQTFLDRLGRYAAGAGLTVQPTVGLTAAVTKALDGADDDVGVEKVRRALEREVAPLIDEALAPVSRAKPQPLPEVLTPATKDEVREHALYLLARMAVHARLKQLLPRGAGAADATGRVKAFHAKFREAYRAMFLEQVVPVSDPQATGDQVVDACARAVAPGLQVSVMGAQNIKGTGLDWVYRWMALDRVTTALKALEGTSVEARRRALESLETFDDSGFVDAGLARTVLPGLVERAGSPDEADRLRKLAERARARHTS